MADPSGSAASNNGEQSVDHALLESLFYDEMMLMDADTDSKLISSSLLSTLAADGSLQNQNGGGGTTQQASQQPQGQQQLQAEESHGTAAAVAPTATAADPTTLAEKALLSDFGVPSFQPNSANMNSSTSPPHLTPLPNPLTNQPSSAASSVAPPSNGAAPLAAAGPSATVSATATTNRPAATTTTRGGIRVPPPPTAAVPTAAATATAMHPFVGTTKSTITMRQQPQLMMQQQQQLQPVGAAAVAQQSPGTPQGYAPQPLQQQQPGMAAPAAPVVGVTASLAASSVPPIASASVPMHPVPGMHSGAPTASVPNAAYYPVQPAVAATKTALPIGATQPARVVPQAAASLSYYPPEPEEEKRTKLVSQFATLASRLGINLPPQVLQSLTGAAATASPTTTATTTGAPTVPPAPTSSLQPQQQQHLTSVPPTAPCASMAVPAPQAAALPPPPPAQPLTVTPEVQELATTAEAAIAAVSSSRKRSLDGTNGTSQQQANGSSEPTEKQPAYSKRRKKPTLSDCEVRLQNLKSENAVLKRHLANVSSKSHLLDQDRIAQAKQMRVMLAKSTQQGGSVADKKALEKKLDVAVQNFTEMYSDYGRRRHHELTFHLEQLQRLANPTNFTKMGLWTLGQQSKDSRNPIAGILQKELGITAQQGKKILEQREKIRNCCSNLKECIVLLGKLKGLCEQKTRIFHDRIEKCREILTPRQVVKLLIWIDDNSESLQEACPGWGSEQILTAKKAAAQK